MITQSSESLPLIFKPFRKEPWYDCIKELLDTESPWFKDQFGKGRNADVLVHFWKYIVACFCEFLLGSAGPVPLIPKMLQQFLDSGEMDFEISLLRNIWELQQKESREVVRFRGTLFLYHRKIGLPISFVVFTQLVRDFIRNTSEMIQAAFWDGDPEQAHRLENGLPVFYPCGVYETGKYFDKVNQNGMTVLQVRGPSPTGLLQGLDSLQHCPWLKMYYVNTRGHVMAVFWLGHDCIFSTQEFCERRKRLLDILNEEYPLLGFQEARKRTVRGILLTGDRQAFCRPDWEVKAFRS